MKIGFDAKRAFHNQTGLGNYSRTLIKNLDTWYPDQQYYFFTPSGHSDYDKYYDPKRIITPNGINPFWRSLGIKRDIVKSGINLFHGLSNELPWGIKKTNIPSVVTFHDVIFDIIPDDFPWHDRILYEIKTKKAIRESAKIISISEATKHDLINRFNAPEDKITVIYQAIDPQFYRKTHPANAIKSIKNRYKLPESFLLYVGAFMKRKNVLPMIKSWEILPDNHKIPFFIFGGGHRHKKEIMGYIHEKQLEKRIHVLPPVPFHELPLLYQLAESVVYPSRYEGFGLPVLEALACGARVVTSTISSMPEAGGDLAVYVNPDEIESISAGIRKSLEQSRPDAVKLTNHLRRFEPEKLTEQVMELYRDVAKI